MRQINLSDYLFLQFGTLTPTLEQIAGIYYPHLKRAQLLEKARNNEFPFPCYRIDESQKAPYMVNLIEFSNFLNKALKMNHPYINTNIHHACKENS